MQEKQINIQCFKTYDMDSLIRVPLPSAIPVDALDFLSNKNGNFYIKESELPIGENFIGSTCFS